jgi:two-component system nitrate/nitrite response regulator NarL
MVAGLGGPSNGALGAVGRAVGSNDLARGQILVIDSDLMVAESIVLALRSTLPTFTAFLAVPVTVEHVQDLMASPPELALLDIDAGDPSTSLACVGVIREAGSAVAVMGGRRDLVLLGECLNAGASAVIDKAAPLSQVMELIVRQLAGDGDLKKDARRVLNGLVSREQDDRRTRLSPFHVLTQREKVVLGELMQGHAAEVIASRSCVSISTVRSQIKAILQKLGVNSQLAAVALARRAGWTLNGHDGDAAASLTARTNGSVETSV